ncbi:Crp/Fnr family transcriptional regulator [Spirosoma lituiforme]
MSAPTPHERLRQAVASLISLNDTDWLFIQAAFEPKTYTRREVLLSAGAVAREVYFVVEGCLRLYYEKEGVDRSAFFFTENQFAGAYNSFITQTPSPHFVETLEPCQLLAVSYDALQRLYTQVPAMDKLVRIVMEDRFVALHKLFTAFVLDSPEERYQHLLREHPDLLHRIPQHHLATYLGITPISLSRIRKRIMHR